MTEKNNKCALCLKHCNKDNMKAVPWFFAPAARFLYACRFPGFNPVQALIKARGFALVCPACRRISILSCIALYLLIIAGITAAFIGK